MAMLMFCEQLSPLDAATHQSLGHMYQASSQQEKALSHYEKAFEGDPVMYWSSYASLLFELGETEQAAAVLEHVAALAPKDVDILESLSAVYSTQQKNKKALAVQDKIDVIEGINSYNTLTRYRLLLAEGKTDKAIQTIDRYLENNPTDLRFRVFRADLYLAQGKEKEAVELYKQELQNNPDNPFVFISLSNYCYSKEDFERAAEYISKAILSEQWDLSQKLKTLQEGGIKRMEYADGLVEQTMQQLIADYPIDEAPYATLAQYYISLTRYKDAKPVLQTMLDINPDNQGTWHTALQVLQADSTSSNEEYESLIRRAYSKMSQDPHWAYWMARLLLNNQQPDSALIVARAGVEQHGDVRYRLGLRIIEGDICTFMNDLPAAYQAYEQALSIDPNNAYVLNNYAYMLATHDGDLRKAEQMSRKTIETEPDNATYLDTYAWILHLQKQDFLAGYYIEKAVNNMKEQEAEEIIQHYIQITGKEPKK